jgi:CBS domain-containing protein
MSSPLVTIEANSSVEAAADIMIQNKVRHLLVVMDMEIDH